MIKHFFLILVCLGVNLVAAQEADIVPLQKELDQAKSDTAKVRILCDMARASRRFDIDKSDEYIDQAFNLAISAGDKFSIARSIASSGATENYKGNYDLALTKTRKAIDVLGADTVHLENNPNAYNEQLAHMYSTIATAYDYKNNQPTAIKYHLISKDIYTRLNNQVGLAVCYNNIGICYLYLEDFVKSEENFRQSEKIYFEMKDTNMAYQITINIAIIEYYKGNLDHAIELYKECSAVMMQLGDLRSATNCYGNIGQTYIELNQYDSALVYLNKAIDADKKLGDPEALAMTYNILGKFYHDQNKFSDARKNYLIALDLAKGINQKSDISMVLGNLAALEESAGNFEEALTYFKMHSAYQDSLTKENNSRSLGKMEAAHEFNKIIENEKSENQRKLAIEAEKQKQQKILIYYSLGSIVVVLIFLLLLYRTLLATRKQKELVQQAKTEIEEKNNELLDSMHYAKRIQMALLNEGDDTMKNLPSHFILFQPKDIVSGDFYWSTIKENYWYVALGDCTGHGVPGAMLTMLGTAYLNEICATTLLLEPAEILDQLKFKITKELSQTGAKGKTKDGMDMSIIRMDLTNQKVKWAGANNSIYYVSKNELHEIKADKQPVGYSDLVSPFTNHDLPVVKGDSIYLFSDGYADQFGGEKGKKFKYSNFKNLLFETDKLEPEIQKSMLISSLQNWQGNLEQLDDICIIGVRI